MKSKSVKGKAQAPRKGGKRESKDDLVLRCDEGGYPTNVRLEMETVLEASLSTLPAPTPGYALAMRVLQSDLYAKLDDVERGECDAMIRGGLNADKPQPTPTPESP